MPKLTIRVFLSPLPRDEGHPEKWRRGWPTPSGVVVRLGEHHLPPTDEEGLTCWEHAQHGDYGIEVDHAPKGFPKPLAVGDRCYEKSVHVGAADHQAVDLLLTPDDDALRLFELRTLYEDGSPLSGVRVKVAGKGFTSRDDGTVYAVCPDTLVEVRPQPHDDTRAVPRDGDFVVDRGGRPRTDVRKVYYEAAPGRITVKPDLGGEAVTGVVFELTRADALDLPPRRLATDATTTELVFEDVPDGTVTLAVVDTSAATYGTDRRRATVDPGSGRITADVRAGDSLPLSDYFTFRPLLTHSGAVTGHVRYRLGAPLKDVRIVARQGDVEKSGVTDPEGEYTIDSLAVGTWTVGLERTPLDVGSHTLTPDPPAEHRVQVTAGDPPTEVPDLVLGDEEHSIRGFVRDQDAVALAYATVEIRDPAGKLVATRQTDKDGFYEWTSPTAGRFLVSVLSEDGEPVQRFPVDVNSCADGSIVFQRRNGHHPQPAPPPPPPPAPDQNLVDLSTFPILTEDVGGAGRATAAPGGDRATGYGQTVENALRDVLGWRPGSNTSGFQAALAGAFELRDVQGHTEFTWHPRGYAVQADLGALTGAQASIYQRAKNALDQVTPLLDGLTPLDPAADPQDTEAIRSIIRAELGELVDELAVEGGPRIQRVDELFTLLAGPRNPDSPLNPDTVGGQLAQLRDRFGLSTSRVGTLDEERIVTNFRIVVDHVLALAAGWVSYRELFSGTTEQTSLGTVLIQLSRSLDVVSQSVDETVFALDSVFVDAAQRQTIPLQIGQGTPPILLSDLLDWVVRVSTSEGPRLIQDAGKDGVIAIAPVLGQLKGLVAGVVTLATTPPGAPGYDPTLPDGLRTPRVLRAFRELAGQLNDTVRLANAVQRREPPEIVFIDVTNAGDGVTTVPVVGRGLVQGSTAVLVAAGRPDLGEIPADSVDTTRPGRATCTFRTLPAGIPLGSLSWLITVVTPAGIRSNTVEALRT